VQFQLEELNTRNLNMNNCLHCGEEVKNKYCNVSCQNKHRNPLKKISRIIINKTCPNCDETFEVETTEKSKKKTKKFCSRRCANIRIHSDNTKKKISNSLYNNPKNIASRNAPKPKKLKLVKSSNKLNKSVKHAMMCNNPDCDTTFDISNRLKNIRKYCSRKCGTTMGGRTSANVQNRRSKNEILFYKLCELDFNNVVHNKPIFNGWDADIILLNDKIAISWNGKWHYEKITEKHSLNQVQNRDKIKNKEIQKMNFRHYIIKDMGKYNPNFVFNEYLKFKKLYKAR